MCVYFIHCFSPQIRVCISTHTHTHTHTHTLSHTGGGVKDVLGGVGGVGVKGVLGGDGGGVVKGAFVSGPRAARWPMWRWG